jgi:hypothetical protein
VEKVARQAWAVIDNTNVGAVCVFACGHVDGAASGCVRHGHGQLRRRPRRLRFGAPIQVTPAPFDPHSRTATGPKHGAWWIGDYQGITARAGAIHLVWNDTRTGKMDLFAATVHP